jgi:hypothetical protein
MPKYGAPRTLAMYTVATKAMARAAASPPPRARKLRVTMLSAVGMTVRPSNSAIFERIKAPEVSLLLPISEPGYRIRERLKLRG